MWHVGQTPAAAGCFWYCFGHWQKFRLVVL
jgi:hypothetical protein